MAEWRDDQRATRVEGCVFCDVLAGEREARTVHEDEETLAFLDSSPLQPGHVLVVPKRHVRTLPEVPAELSASLMAAVQRLCVGVESAMGAEGTFVAVNNKVSQSVPHLHVHVVPRRRGDGLKGFFWPRHRYAEGQADEVAEAVREAMRALP